MRRLGHFIIFCVFIVSIMLIAKKIDFSFLTLERDKSKQSLLEMSSLSLIHRQIDSQWLEFSLNQSSNSIRLLSNAAISEHYAVEVEVDTNWRYAIEYQLIDINEQVISQQIYHHRSRINWLKNQQGQLLSQSFFLNNDLLPTLGSEIVLKTTTFPALSKIRIRIHSKSPQIQYIFFRLYEQKVVADNKIEYLWQRLSQEEREKISRFSVYGTDFLRDSERYQMLKYRWKVVGPNGIAEKHFQTEKLYINKDELIIPIEDEIAVEQIDADEYFYHTIPIPEQGGLFSMEIQHMSGELNPYSNQININWFGKGRFKREQMSFNLQQGPLWEKQLEGGLLEIRSQQPITITSWLTIEGKKQEIKPDNVFISAYSLTAEQTLDYPVEHIKQQSTQIKITIRALLGQDEHSAKNIKLNYSYYQKGKKISSDEIKTELVRSTFDRVLNFNSSNSFSESLSEPYDYYLNVPIQADQIILTSQQPVLVNLANRPASFYKRTRVPEDYYKIREVKYSHPLWFALQTKNQQELLHQKRRIIISRQSRPPEDEQINSFSSYEWEDYFPVAHWQARYLFNPRNNDFPVNEELLHLYYHPVSVNRSNNFNFSAANSVSTFEPSLIFLRKSKKISKVKVYIDGELQLDRPLISTRGQLKLPAMKAGRHDIRILSEASIKWFINHSKVQSKVQSKDQLKEEPEYYIKRLSTQIRQQELNFDFDKNKANMVLSGLFQSHYGSTERTLLQVSISPDTRKMKNYGYTLLNRQFDIRPDNTQAINVLNTSDKYVGAGQRFFIPLGEDLPLGKYRIKLQLLEGAPGYISLYTLDFGQLEKYHFFKTKLIDE